MAATEYRYAFNTVSLKRFRLNDSFLALAHIIYYLVSSYLGLEDLPDSKMLNTENVIYVNSKLTCRVKKNKDLIRI